MYKAVTVLCLVSLMATSGCIFAESSSNENNTNNENNTTKDMQSGDMTKMDMSSDMPNPTDATADATDPADMAPDITPPEDMEPDMDPPPAGVLYVFVTEEPVDLTKGLEAADDACNADLPERPTTGLYKAMLGHPERRPCFTAMECLNNPGGYNWVLQPDQQYVRKGRTSDQQVKVFKTTARAKFFEMEDQVRPGGGINFASGFDKLWKVVPAMPGGSDCGRNCRTTCGNWNAPNVESENMAVGWTGAKDATDLGTDAGHLLDGGVQRCGKNRVLCVEQPTTVN